MKKWDITIEASNEKEALKLLNVLVETFNLSSKIDEPLHHVYSDDGKGSKIICEENRNFNK